MIVNAQTPSSGPTCLILQSLSAAISFLIKGMAEERTSSPSGPKQNAKHWKFDRKCMSWAQQTYILVFFVWLFEFLHFLHLGMNICFVFMVWGGGQWWSRALSWKNDVLWPIGHPVDFKQLKVRPSPVISLLCFAAWLIPRPVCAMKMTHETVLLATCKRYVGMSKNGSFQIPVGHHVVHSWSSNGHIPHFQTHPCGPPRPSRPSSVFSCPRLLDKDIALSRLVHSKIIVQVDDLKEWFGRRFPGHKMGFLFEILPASDGNVLESPNLQTNPGRRWKLNESAHPGVGKMQGWPKEASWLIESLRYHPFKWWSIHSYSQILESYHHPVEIYSQIMDDMISHSKSSTAHLGEEKPTYGAATPQKKMQAQETNCLGLL